MGKSLQTMRILWAALASSPVLLWVMMIMVTEGGFAGHLQPAVLGGAALAAFSMAVTSFVLPRMLFLQGVKALELGITNDPDPNAAAAFRDMVPTRRVFADREKALLAAYRVDQTRLIISLSMSEAIALIGVALGVTLHPDEPVLAPFFVASFLLMLARFPTEAAVVARLENAYGAKLT